MRREHGSGQSCPGGAEATADTDGTTPARRRSRRRRRCRGLQECGEEGPGGNADARAVCSEKKSESRTTVADVSDDAAAITICPNADPGKARVLEQRQAHTASEVARQDQRRPGTVRPRRPRRRGRNPTAMAITNETAKPTSASRSTAPRSRSTSISSPARKQQESRHRSARGTLTGSVPLHPAQHRGPEHDARDDLHEHRRQAQPRAPVRAGVALRTRPQRPRRGCRS